VTAPSRQRVLTRVERHSEWKSTLNGARYRWRNDQWEVLTVAAPDWHPANVMRATTVIVAHATEFFEEVRGAQ